MNDTSTITVELNGSPLMNIDLATKYLQLSTATLARMRRDKNGPAFVQMGSRVMYRKADLDAFIESSLIQQGE